MEIEAPVEQPKRKGNPNFGKKKEEPQNEIEAPEFVIPPVSQPVEEVYEQPVVPVKHIQAQDIANQTIFMGHVINPKKRYRFQLIKTYEKLKPRDHETGELVDSLYPPKFMVNNEGISYDANGNMRRWRYIWGYPTIWVDEQITPLPSDQQLRDGRNDIIFEEGNLFVDGGDKAKVMALFIQDQFEDQKNPVTHTPKTFRMINEEDGVRVAMGASDRAFEAENEARKATLAEMLPIAMLFGINVDNPESREDLIRGEFILKARQLPDAFLKQFVNPKNQIKYLITKAIRENIISGSNGRLTMVGTGKVLFNVDPTKDLAEQVASLVMSNDGEANLLYAQIQKLQS